MDHFVFNFFSDKKETVVTNLSAYLGRNRLDVEKALEYGCSVESFIDDLHLDLNALDSSNVSIIGRHVTTSAANGICSIAEKGLLNLAQSIQEDTPLSWFLKRHKIHIDVENKLFSYREKSISIEERKNVEHICFMGRETACMWSFGCEAFQKLSVLGNKLYNLGATLEFFISGTLDQMLSYSTVSKCPEILDTIDQLISAIWRPYATCTYPLCQNWIAKNPICYVIEFEAKLTDMETYNPISYIDAYREISGCFKWSDITYDDYCERRIPQRVFDNRFLILSTISAIVYYSGEEYGSLLPGLSISPEKLKIYEVANGQLVET